MRDEVFMICVTLIVALGALALAGMSDITNCYQQEQIDALKTANDSLQRQIDFMVE